VSDGPTAFSRAFDARVLFDYYFPGVLPDPAHVPADYEISEPLGKKIADLMKANPESAAAMEHVRGIHNDKDLVDNVLFATWVLRDIERRAGGNPFDNRDTIYTGTPDDNALNDGVKRYAADAGALAYLQRYYTPTGHLTRPVLAIHSTYDPIVSPSVVESYALLTRTAGSGDLFVAHYVKHDGHCHITPEEIERGFNELIDWTVKGKKPEAGGMR
jgi:pimeloyl-ACP methyl ester carboxylesterase